MQAVKEESEEEIINVDLSVSEVIDIYGQRYAACPRAQPCPRPSPEARRLESPPPTPCTD